MTKSQSFDSAATTSELPVDAEIAKRGAPAEADIAAHVDIRACLNIKHLRRIRDVAGQIVIRWDGCVGVGIEVEELAVGLELEHVGGSVRGWGNRGR